MGAWFRWIKKIYEGHKAVGQRVETAAATLPETDTGDLFNIVGKVVITSLVGEIVSTLNTNPVVIIGYTKTSGAFHAICKETGLHTVIGALCSLNGTSPNSLMGGGGGSAALAAGLAGVLSGPMVSNQAVIRGPGKIQIQTTNTVTGTMKWTLHYLPLDPTSVVTAA